MRSRATWRAKGLVLAAGLAGTALLAWLLPPLGSLGGVWLYTRLDGDRILQHETRRRILDAVESQPGLTLQGLQVSLGVAWGTALHHVAQLHRHGQLVSVRQGPRRLLFAARTPAARLRTGLAVLRSSTTHALACEVVRAPGSQAGDLARRLGFHASVVSKHLARLREAGLVECRRESGALSCWPAPQLEETLRLRQECTPRPDPIPEGSEGAPTAVFLPRPSAAARGASLL